MSQFCIRSLYRNSGIEYIFLSIDQIKCLFIYKHVQIAQINVLELISWFESVCLSGREYNDILLLFVNNFNYHK